MSVVVGRTLEQFNQSHSLGESVGGNVICKTGGIIWIVAPAATEVSRNWTDRGDAITTASAYTAAYSSASYASPVQNHPGAVCCGAWFISSCSQLSNPGYLCRTNWDSYSNAYYWSTSGFPAYPATWKTIVSMATGAVTRSNIASTYCVRAFRCVTY
jgi:hypothetical protein